MNQNYYLVAALIFVIMMQFTVSIFIFLRNFTLKKRYNLFMEALDRAAIIMTTDLDGIIVSVNDRFCETSGYKRSELLGKHSRILKSGLHSEQYYKNMWNTISSGKIWNGEVCNRRKDGSYFWVDGPILPLFNRKGKIEKYIAFRQNVTNRKEFESQLMISRKQLQENLDWRRNILDSANYLIIATDKDGIILTFNNFAEDKLGYKSSEIVGRTTPIIFHKMEELIIQSRKDTDANVLDQSQCDRKDQEFQALVEASTQSRATVEKEMTYLKRDGTCFPVRLSISCLINSENEITGYLIIGSDITQERVIKNQLIQAKEMALRASQVKSDFLANMSHEIRTPLNGVIGMTDLLIESGLNSDQNRCAEIVLFSAQNLLALINDILDFSKIESGKMELEKISFNLKSVINDHLQTFKFTAEKKGIYLKSNITDLPYEVFGDPARLGQVLNNLIGNAIKFTQIGGVTLSCELEEDRNNYVRLKFLVQDTGIGIPEEAKGRIFQSFSQGDRSISRKYGGSGLGLSIVKLLVEMMGGSVQFESADDIGTTFWFSLEFRKGSLISNMDSQIKRHNDFPLLDGKILLAEDVVTNQQLFSRMLKKFGCRYHVVSNGLEAIHALDSSDFDLILMDCQMPEMDGYEATQVIRGQIPEIPIVALTANALNGDREKCLQSGMNDYLSKPVTQASLHKTLSKYLKTKEINL